MSYLVTGEAHQLDDKASFKRMQSQILDEIRNWRADIESMCVEIKSPFQFILMFRSFYAELIIGVAAAGWLHAGCWGNNDCLFLSDSAEKKRDCSHPCTWEINGLNYEEHPTQLFQFIHPGVNHPWDSSWTMMCPDSIISWQLIIFSSRTCMLLLHLSTLCVNSLHTYINQ